MQKLLIAEYSEEIRNELVRLLRDEFAVKTCNNGADALDLLQTFQPEAMILNLMLPFVDGLTLLEQTVYKPAAILAVSSFINDQIAARALQLGIGTLLITPAPRVIMQRLMDLVQNTGLEERPNPQVRTARLLQMMHFSSGRDGYRQLCVGIPLFAKDPHQSLSKELYPAIAQLCGCKSGVAIEHSIRCAIEDAWKNRDPRIWQRCFPDELRCPSNKVLIARIAEMLNL